MNRRSFFGRFLGLLGLAGAGGCLTPRARPAEAIRRPDVVTGPDFDCYCSQMVVFTTCDGTVVQTVPLWGTFGEKR